MADSIVTQEEMALRRRARRRLVGAVAIALTAVLVLPMLFDPEPKPLGPEVDIRIPAKDTPFEPTHVPAMPPLAAAPEPAPKVAEPTLPVAAQATAQAAPATDADKPAAVAVEAGSSAPKPSLPDKSEPAKAPSAKAMPDNKPAPAAPAAGAIGKAKADQAFATRGYFLQLGAFGSAINARQLQEKAEAAGFKAVTNDANGQYRVRIGPIAGHDKALEIQSRLKAKGFSPVLLGP